MASFQNPSHIGQGITFVTNLSQMVLHYLGTISHSILNNVVHIHVIFLCMNVLCAVTECDKNHVTHKHLLIIPVDVLGVIFDSDLNFETHIKNIIKTYFYHLRNIAKVQPFLAQADTERLMHAFITSRLDYCNSLLSGLPKKSH